MAIIVSRIFFVLIISSVFVFDYGQAQNARQAGEMNRAATQSDAKSGTKEAKLAMLDAVIAKSQSTSGPGEPALWMLADDDTTLYFFGTVHVMHPDVNWQSRAVQAAFDASDTLVLEADVISEAGQKAAMVAFMGRGVFQDGQTLSASLEPEIRTALETALASLDLPMAAIDSMEPWLANINLTMIRAMSEGYDPEIGVDIVLAQRAAQAGKTLAYLETVARQVDAFDNLPQSEQIATLYDTALLWDRMPQLLEFLINEWVDGDVVGLGALFEPDAGGMGEAAYQALLVKRNQEWKDKVIAMLDQPGTVFIAVGAGHLVGPDSLINMLQEADYTVQGPLLEPVQ